MDIRTLKQASGLLLVSMGLGLAGNALNPAGLRFSESSISGNPDRGGGTADTGVYLNQTLYSNETLSVRLVTNSAPGGPPPPYPARTVSSVSAPPAGSPAAPARTTWAAVKSRAESGNILLVDSRSRIAFDAGHIPGAVCLPYKSLQTEIHAFTAAWPRDAPLAIYCANANCAASRKLAMALINTYRYHDVCYIPGGYLEWRKAGGK